MPFKMPGPNEDKCLGCGETDIRVLPGLGYYHRECYVAEVEKQRQRRIKLALPDGEPSITYEIVGDTELKVETYPDGTKITRHHKKVAEPPHPPKRSSITFERKVTVTVTPDMINADKRDEVWAWLEERCILNKGVFTADRIHDLDTKAVFTIEDALPGLDDVVGEYVEDNEDDIGENIADRWAEAIDEWKNAILAGKHFPEFCPCSLCRTIGEPYRLAKEAESRYKQFKLKEPYLSRLKPFVDRATTALTSAHEDFPIELYLKAEAILDPIVDAINDA